MEIGSITPRLAHAQLPGAMHQARPVGIVTEQSHDVVSPPSLRTDALLYRDTRTPSHKIVPANNAFYAFEETAHALSSEPLRNDMLNLLHSHTNESVDALERQWHERNEDPTEIAIAKKAIEQAEHHLNELIQLADETTSEETRKDLIQASHGNAKLLIATVNKTWDEQVHRSAVYHANKHPDVLVAVATQAASEETHELVIQKAKGNPRVLAAALYGHMRQLPIQDNTFERALNNSHDVVMNAILHKSNKYHNRAEILQYAQLLFESKSQNTHRTVALEPQSRSLLLGVDSGLRNTSLDYFDLNATVPSAQTEQISMQTPAGSTDMHIMPLLTGSLPPSGGRGFDRGSDNEAVKNGQTDHVHS